MWVSLSLSLFLLDRNCLMYLSFCSLRWSWNTCIIRSLSIQVLHLSFLFYIISASPLTLLFYYIIFNHDYVLISHIHYSSLLFLLDGITIRSFFSLNCIYKDLYELIVFFCFALFVCFYDQSAWWKKIKKRHLFIRE